MDSIADLEVHGLEPKLVNSLACYGFLWASELERLTQRDLLDMGFTLRDRAEVRKVLGRYRRAGRTCPEPDWLTDSRARARAVRQSWDDRRLRLELKLRPLEEV